jgi:DNA polymerase-3 subunit alpha
LSVTDSFAHCHVHTEFSLLDGASRVDEVVAAAAMDGQPALGITDHGNMYGILPFYEACQKADITPMLGTEAYMAHDTRTERIRRRSASTDEFGEGDGGTKQWYHLTLLAENNTGYRNLIQLSSRAYLEGYYYKPRVDWELLAEHADGLIATTGCLGGHVAQSLLAGDFDAALAKAGRLQEIFGKDNLFIELQDHGIEDQQRILKQLIEISERLGAPLLATNDSHYTNPEDAEAHDALLCVQTKAQISDAARFRFQGHGHYLKSAEEMRHLFRELPQACDNTLWVAGRCGVELEFGKPKLPDFPLPEGFATAGEYLRHMTFEGAKVRWGDSLADELVERLAFELKVIEDMGFSAYFLIVWDLIRHAKEHGIRVGPGRGSAAGCAVAYCLKITDLDPIRYGLIFERFLNPSRASMPDIDMDFDSRYRDEMIRYATEKYGRDRVAQIITFSTIKARASVRDAARVLGYPYAVGDKVAKAMPPMIMGRDTPLSACIAPRAPAGWEDGWKVASELRRMAAEDPEVQRVLNVAKGLEGMRRSDGIHAAAVVITKDPLTEYLPVQRKPEAGRDPAEAPVVTQYEMHGVEDLGLLKMDFLGLRNLDVISDALVLIRQTQGIELDIDNVDLSDERTLAMLCRGDSMGVFQLEGAQMRSLMRSLAPTCFEDIAALVALYRPGPMAANMHTDFADRKNGRQKVTFLHPDAEEILGDTYGLMIYQEKLMQVAQQFAGYSLTEADNLRRACGKKIREKMAAERERFVSSCVANGYSEQLGTTWFDIIEPFADYAFPKAHAFGYGYIAYQTAYLKANYPTEYFAALLTSVKENLDKAGVYLAECRTLGIEVIVPDVNRSEVNFTPVRSGDGPGQIVFGLSAVRGVGANIAAGIVAARTEGGPFSDVYDFCERVPLGALNKGTMEALIRGGAFDSLGYARKGLLWAFEEITASAGTRRKERENGVMSLFDSVIDDTGVPLDGRTVVSDDEFDKKEKLALEKEMLGLYISDHPLRGLEDKLRQKIQTGLASVKELPDGHVVMVAGVITNLETRYTKKGDLMASFALEDLEDTMEVLVFPRTMTEYGKAIESDAVVVLKARVDRRDDDPKLIATDLSAFSEAGGGEPLHLRISEAAMTERTMNRLREILKTHTGATVVVVHVAESGRAFRLGTQFNVNVDTGVGDLIRAAVPQVEVLAGPPPATQPPIAEAS